MHTSSAPVPTSSAPPTLTVSETAAALRDSLVSLITEKGPLSAGEIAHLTRQPRSNVRNAAHRLMRAGGVIQKKIKTNKNRGGVSIYALPATTDDQWRTAMQRVKANDDAAGRDWFPASKKPPT